PPTTAPQLSRAPSPHSSVSPNSDGQKRGATVSFHDIHYKVPEGGGCSCRKKATKDILIDLNGIMKPGLNAIMGATGSGKSSFLDVLAARKDPSGLSGQVLIDGAPQPPNFKCLSGYVVQVCAKKPTTHTKRLRSSLLISSCVMFPGRRGDGDSHGPRELEVLRRAASVGTQMIRGISGGERKRTNIGMELIIDPSVLFLDEPTTGLDASTACSVLLLLKRMANHGRTIILSIHQPRYSIYRLFDNLTLLVNGKQVYHGLAPDALDYFSDIGYTCEPHNNPADFFLDVINGDSTAVARNNPDNNDPDLPSSQAIEDKLVQEYKTCNSYRQTKAELEKIVSGRQSLTTVRSRTITYNTGFFTQFRWVLHRTFWNLALNPQTSVAQVLVTAFLALVVGALFFDASFDQTGVQNRFGALFFITVNQCFGSLSSAELFITERKLFVHEYISGYYRVSVYFLSKVLADIISLRTIPAVVFTCIIYYMIGLKDTGAAFILFMFTVALVAYTATSMSLAISADQNVVAIANLYMTISFVFMMIFAGLLVNLPSIAEWLVWLKYLSIPRYGFAALQINEFVGLEFCETKNTTTRCESGELILEKQGVDYSSWGLWQNHVALLVMNVIFLSIAYLKLRFIKKFT
uniref:ATP-binding cassette, sub-family G (WHITE), member 2a n=1 Tax=Neogobius melanostomus TaxID=47308 RepID=A0A8C6TIJ2_9GOBI